MSRAAIAWVLMAAAVPAVMVAQDRSGESDPPVFRSRVTLVQIDASVVDGQGRPVSGLTAEDFEVIEAGEPRPVVTFFAVDVPFDLPPGVTAAGAPEPDVRTNETPPGRTYLIALDEVSPDRVLRARNLVRTFVEEHLGPNDVAAVALTGRGLASSGQDFTRSRRLILNAVEKFTGGFEISTPNTQVNNGGFMGPGVDRAFSSDSRQLASSLRGLTEFLATLPGRKTLLYVGEGVGNIDFNKLVKYNGTSLTPTEADAHAAIAAATRGNVTIYPVDPRGLTTDLTPAGLERPLLESESLDTRADLNVLADITGGFAIANTNEVYDNRRAERNEARPPIELTAKVLSGRGRVLRLAADPTRAEAPVLEGSGGQGFTARLPLGGLPPGPYVIQVEARSGNAPAVSRSIPVSLR